MTTKPKNNFNTCDDFFQLVITSFIVTATMELLGMTSLTSSPSSEFFDPDTVMTKSRDEKRQILEGVCNKVVKKFTQIGFNQLQVASGGDKVQEYSKNLLSIGTFYLEYQDAIREGDGLRVIRCWKYLLPIFSHSGRRNYCIEAFKLLYQYHYILPPRQAQQLVWSRFVNTKGTCGHNIPMDLHLEHLNRLVKNSIQSLGPNRKGEAVVRCGKALGTIHTVLENFDQDNNIEPPSGAHSSPSYQKDLGKIVNELIKERALVEKSPRRHLSFPRTSNILHSKPPVHIVTWLVEHLPK